MEQTQYVIPQFIDIEPRILGPVTVRQFVISIGGMVLIVVNYKLFDFALFVLLSFCDVALVILFGFVKIYGIHFHLFLLNYFATMKRARIRVWRKEVRDFVITGEIGKREEVVVLQRKVVSRSRLAELSLVVNTGGRYEQELREYWQQ